MAVKATSALERAGPGDGARPTQVLGKEGSREVPAGLHAVVVATVMLGHLEIYKRCGLLEEAWKREPLRETCGEVFSASYRKPNRSMEVSRGQLKKEAGWEKEVRCSPCGKLPPSAPLTSGLKPEVLQPNEANQKLAFLPLNEVAIPTGFSHETSLTADVAA